MNVLHECEKINVSKNVHRIALCFLLIITWKCLNFARIWIKYKKLVKCKIVMKIALQMPNPKKKYGLNTCNMNYLSA